MSRSRVKRLCCCCCVPRHDCLDPFSVRLCCNCPRVWLLRALCRLFSTVCANATGWYRDDSSTQSCVAPKTQEKATDCKVASASEMCDILLITGKEQCRRKVEGNRKIGNVVSAGAGLGKLRFDGTERMNPRRHCKSGKCQQRGHHSEFAHHESLLKSINAGAPVAARDAISNRI